MEKNGYRNVVLSVETIVRLDRIRDVVPKVDSYNRVIQFLLNHYEMENGAR